MNFLHHKQWRNKSQHFFGIRYFLFDKKNKTMKVSHKRYINQHSDTSFKTS